MIKSRTSSTSLIPNPPLPTSVALHASKPLRLGVRSPKRALRPNSSLRKIAFLGPAFAQLDDTGRRVERRDGRRALRGVLQTIIRDGLRHHACIRVDPDFAPPMDWLRLHMATRIQFGARAAICPWSNFARVDEQRLQCAYPAITRWRKESLVAAPAGTRPRAARLSRARRILRRGRDGLCVPVLSVRSDGRSVARNRRPLFIHD